MREAVISMDAIHSVSEFSREPEEYIKRLKATGKPEILTINGKAEIIIQDARAYEDMVTLLDSLEKTTLAAKEHEEGKGIAADDAFCALTCKRIGGKFPDADI